MAELQGKLQASSATEGFFQSLPSIPPQYTSQTSKIKSEPSEPTDDAILPRLLSLYLPKPLPIQIDQHLHHLSREILKPNVQRWTVDAETNLPTLHPLTTFGTPNETDALRTSEGWRQLKDLGIRNGSVALGYSTLDGQPADWNRRIHQMAMDHLWAGSAALVTCPAAMSDGAAILLGKHLDDEDGDQPGRAAVLKEARRRLVSFDPEVAWTSGQWMTERSGGSDVRGTETTAYRLSRVEIETDEAQFGSGKDSIGMELGPWRIDGFKWFSSATDADMVVMLARTPKGLSAFFAPMRRCRRGKVAAVMNGVRITRLKSKLGTKALPTSELEIRGMRGWLVGEEGKGVKEIASILNATRIWTATGALGGLTRGLAISRAYSRVRKVQGALLQDNLQHVAWMSEETVKYRAGMHLAFLGVALLGLTEQGDTAVKGTYAAQFMPTDRVEAEILLRLLVPVMKAQCSLAAVNGLRACMESLGGVGYCENNDDGGMLNIARVFRDTNVNPIWEGTTSVMAEDVVRVLKGNSGQQALTSLESLIKRLVGLSQSKFADESSVILAAWVSLKRDIEDADAPELHYTGRALLASLENILCSLLLMIDTLMDHDTVAEAVLSRWMRLKFAREREGPQPAWRESAAMDQRVFLGDSNKAPNLKASL